MISWQKQINIENNIIISKPVAFILVVTGRRTQKLVNNSCVLLLRTHTHTHFTEAKCDYFVFARWELNRTKENHLVLKRRNEKRKRKSN